jgi:hypothetical protein
VLERDALHRAADDHRPDTGVVEEDVEAAERADGARDDRRAVVRLRQIRGDGHDLAARRAHVGLGARQLGFAHVDDGDGGARAREQQRARATDPGRGAGDDGDPAPQRAAVGEAHWRGVYWRPPTGAAARHPEAPPAQETRR